MNNRENKVNLEYQLLHEQEIEELLENSKLPEKGKEAVRSAAKNIITAQVLMENNSLVDEELLAYYEDTKSKFEDLKNRLKGE